MSRSRITRPCTWKTQLGTDFSVAFVALSLAESTQSHVPTHANQLRRGVQKVHREENIYIRGIRSLVLKSSAGVDVRRARDEKEPCNR